MSENLTYVKKTYKCRRSVVTFKMSIFEKKTKKSQDLFLAERDYSLTDFMQTFL
jgi:hypothetical protein